MDLDKLFFPRSVCVVGASRDPTAYGHIILKNLITGGFKGKIFPVNPRADVLLDLKCYSSIRDIPAIEDIDLAVIAVPAKVVPDVMVECGERQIPFTVVISAGFKEIGDAGRELEEQVLRIVKDHGIRMVGPNCMGVYSSCNNFTATFTSLVPKQGAISFISQSGGVGITMLAWAKGEGIGFSKFVSVGNESDLSIVDFFDYLENDDSTRVITAYIESVRNGRALVKSLSSISSKKPVIVMKVGTTQSGIKAAASHTGAMAVEDSVIDGIFKQFSIIRVNDTEELFRLATSFATLPLPRGRSAAILSSGGGWAVECSDLLEEKALLLPPLPLDAVKYLDTILPPYWSKRNPVDMVAARSSETYLLTVERLLKQEEFDMVFLIGYGVFSSIAVPALSNLDVECALKISSLVKEVGKPLFIVDVLGPDQSESARTFERAGLPIFSTVRAAVDTAAEMTRYSEYLQKKEAKGLALCPPSRRLERCWKLSA